ncbi:AMP-dependent synthetase [Cryobacterium sp. TMT1-21]|uniref:AMP-binding protein n=1 Tax=unclassified Cryobacterium TaxID=2649013 RepID=UPI00106D3C24|nr:MULTISPECIES: AMP-binding protein [unclassified Cryobacterium]TFD15694.1 AMP-dependent synthetase [Cryobacterium sp. TMT1-21]TFD18993.1 AMP-dependent synthetase [Cryobacterium sp. TMT2-23]
MTNPQSTTSFRDARDRLLQLRDVHAQAAAEFEWPDVGAHFNWATDWFDVMAAGNDKTALWIVEEDGRELKVSFAEMLARSDQVATWLTRHGVGHGDHVMLMLGNQVELWELMLAIMKVGAVILPTSTVLSAHDLADRVARGGVGHVIANAHDADKFDTVAGDYSRICVGEPAEGWTDYADADLVVAEKCAVVVASDDPSLIYFTSGTTSKPKMVVHTQTSYPVGHLTTMYWIGLRPGDVHLAISSPGWGKHAWSSFFSPWIAEATVFVYNYGRFDPFALADQLHRAKVTTFCAPPTVWRMLIQSDLGVKPLGLREILSAGEPLNPEVITQIQRAWGLTIRDGYGQTETTAIVGNAPGSILKAGSMGLPLPGVAVTLLDPITGEVTEEGEICLDLSRAAVNLMAGYHGDPERTAEAVRDGYFHTGDVASRDSDGYITFIGRTDDIFKSSDYKVSPFEVESVLLEHPAVAEAAVVPAPDDTRLNIAKAYVALAAGWDADGETALSVLRHARTGLPPYMRVRRVEFYELPKTSSGKIRRVELRMREDAAAEQGVRLPGEWRDDQFPELKR